ncbi:hypothetical protein [Glycomyces algeriensis]|nr:hypothetical protein [Glycomyces algeriensis]MDA1367515.1 hypothetical protein [Glycomyces algeriensis]MDR7353122.1 hypothetical protein [Glycomyces algeriensis]
MAALWAVLLGLGGWAAPGIAASGNPENTDSRDEAASSANNAAWRYLRYGSNQDLERSEDTLCEDASPEVTPSDLNDLRQSYSDELGGITDVDLETGDPVTSSDGVTVAATVSYIYQGSQRHEEFIVTVQESDGVYCVSNAVRIQGEEPSPSDGTGEPVDAQALVTDFMRSIVNDRDPEAAKSFQCDDSFEGITPEDLDAAITVWAEANGETVRFLSAVDPAESSETSVTAFAVEVFLEADLNKQEFDFVVGVQGNCVVSLEGGDGLF